jgi:hypothetical protein
MESKECYVVLYYTDNEKLWWKKFINIKEANSFSLLLKTYMLPDGYYNKNPDSTVRIKIVDDLKKITHCREIIELRDDYINDIIKDLWESNYITGIRRR